MSAVSRAKTNVQMLLDEREGDEEADEQRDDGVRDALAQLVEMLEKRHPPFGRFVVVRIVRRRRATT